MESHDNLQQHRRGAVEAKLHYFKDIFTPEDFECLIEEELERPLNQNSEADLKIKEISHSIKKCLRKIFHQH